MEGAKGEEGRPWLSLFLVQFDVSKCYVVHTCSVVGSKFLVKVELPMLQLLLGWRLDTDTQISSNNCEVNPFVNWGGPGSCAKW